MKKNNAIVILILFGCCLRIEAQFGGLYKHADACELMLTQSESRLQAQDTSTALIICKEAFDEALKAGDANLVTRVKLFELNIYHERENFTAGLESALFACKFSEFAFDDLKLLTYMRTLRFFEDFGMQEIGIDLVEKAMAIPTEDSGLTAYLMSIQASNLIKVNKNDQAVKMLQKWINHTRDNNLQNDRIKACYSLGMLLNKMKLYPNAILAFEEMNMLSGWTKDKLLSAVGLNNIALCQQKSGLLSAADHNFQQAISTCPTNAPEFQEILLNYAYFLNEEKKKDQALEYAMKAKDLAIAAKNNRVIIKASIIVASLLNDTQRTSESITICNEMIELASRYQFDDLKLNALELNAICFAAINDRDSERSTLSQINALKSKISETEKMSNDRKNNNLIVVEQIQKNIDRFYSALEQKRLQSEKYKLDIINRNQEKEIMAIEQQLTRTEFERAAAEKEKVKRDLDLLRIKLDNQQKQNDIVELESNKASQMLSLTQLELDKQGQETKLLLAEKQNEILKTETYAQEEKIQKEKAVKRIGYGIGAFSFLGMIVAIFITKKFRSNNRIIKVKNHELKIKNDDIHKSITSASYFQGAIAADTKVINRQVKSGFVYYSPLDIVSGDLPFVENINGKTYLAAIDCMGHGVSAAMLSFTAYYNLKQLIEQNHEADLADILKLMDDQVIQSLKSKGEESKFHAGMDISLVRINKEDNIIEFSGAKSPLIICKEEACEIIKGSPYSVGDMCDELNTSFTSHRIDIDPDARYFLMSDGYCHQLGGPTSEKIFSKKRLTKLLTSIHRFNSTELRQQLETELNNWRGNTLQTDDVLVIGFQI